MKSLSLVALCLATLAACTPDPRSRDKEERPDAGDTTPDAGNETPDAGEEPELCEGPAAKQPRALPIRNGELNPTAFAITSGQQAAIGALLFNYGSSSSPWWSNGCTGTLIAPTWVITASHCLYDWSGTTRASDVRFGIGPDMDEPDYSFAVKAVHVHPSYPRNNDDARYDVALLQLSSDVLEAVPGITPIKMNRSAIPSSRVGDSVQAVGYGATHPNDDSNTKRYWTTELLHSVTSVDVTIDGQGQSAVCFGDSGGPLLMLDEGGELTTYGALSWGDETCLDVDHYSRHDLNLTWIDGLVGEIDPPGCGSVTSKGLCSGNSLSFCNADRLTTVDCAATGEVCLVDGSGQAACVEDKCFGFDFTGTCEGTNAVWCENNVLKNFDCGQCGQECGFVSASLGYFCK